MMNDPNETLGFLLDAFRDGDRERAWHHIEILTDLIAKRDGILPDDPRASQAFTDSEKNMILSGLWRIVGMAIERKNIVLAESTMSLAKKIIDSLPGNIDG